ncbi:RDD family protein [Polaribacter sp.]|nr:RDD family protein [Polaribacter sp.]
MKSLQIKTAQNVQIDFVLANVGQRLLAFVIDNVVKIGYLLMIIFFFDFNVFQEYENDSWTIQAIWLLIMLPVIFYTLYLEILLDGQTLGKKLMRIKVINLDGFKPSISDFAIRWFLRIVDFNSFALLAVFLYSMVNSEVFDTLLNLLLVLGKIVGLLLISFTKKNQRFGDMIANTTVIYLKDSAKFSDTILENITTTYKPTYPNVIRLSDNDARIIKTTFLNAKKTNDFKMLIKLRTKIIEVTQIQSVHNSDTAFIDAVLKDYNFYTQNM